MKINLRFFFEWPNIECHNGQYIQYLCCQYMQWPHWILPVHTRNGFPGSSAGKESSCNAGDLGSIPMLGSSPGGRKGYPLQYSWASPVPQMVKNPPAKKQSWFYPWFGKIPWRRAWQLTPVFFPGESHGQRSLTVQGVTKTPLKQLSTHTRWAQPSAW